MSERLQSFRYALQGMALLVRETHNARLHLAATLAVAALGYLVGLSPLEWSMVLLAVGLVWVAEALNTALEYLADAAIPEYHELIRKAKDTAAAAVLCAALVAAAVGLVIFIPYLH